MRPRDWFSVGIRLIGAWIYYRALGDLVITAAWFVGAIPASAEILSHSGNEMLYNLMYAAGNSALATYFVFGAEHLTRWSFYEDTPDDDANALSGSEVHSE